MEYLWQSISGCCCCLLIIGIVGGIIAGWLMPIIGIFNIGGIVGSIIYSVIGAVILLLIVGFIKKR